MNKEFSAGAIVFKREEDTILFLIIYSERNRLWGFPKGHLEHGESMEQAAAREIKEETSLGNLEFINGFKEEVVYETVSTRLPFKGQKIEKYVTYFLCEIKNRDIVVDGREITDYRFLVINEAEELVKFCNLNKVLRRAYDFLSAL